MTEDAGGDSGSRHRRGAGLHRDRAPGAPDPLASVVTRRTDGSPRRSPSHTPQTDARRSPRASANGRREREAATARRAVAEAEVAVSPETMSLVIDGGDDEGRRPHRGGAGRRDGRQAHVGADPALPPDPADRPVRRHHAPTAPPACSASAPRPRPPGPTGVEMEAMTAASVAALTVYDMVKGVERGVEIRALRLLSKTGGKSGEWHRPPTGDAGPGPGGTQAIGPRAASASASRSDDAPSPCLPQVEPCRPPRARAHGQRPGRGRHARGPSGELAAGRLAALGFTRGAADRPGRRGRRSPRPSTRAPATMPWSYHRRHGPDAARRHAAGDLRAAGLRDPGLRRGDARRGPPDHPVRRALAGVVGRSSWFAWSRTCPARPRGRWSRSRCWSRSSPTRSRPWPGRSTTPLPGPRGVMTCHPACRKTPDPCSRRSPRCRHIRWSSRSSGARSRLRLMVVRHAARVHRGVRGWPDRPSEIGPARSGGLVRYAILQTRMFRDGRAGLLHYAIFLGSTILLIGNSQHRHRRAPAGGHRLARSTACSGRCSSRLQNLAAVGVLVGLGFAVLAPVRPASGPPHPEPRNAMVLVLIAAGRRDGVPGAGVPGGAVRRRHRRGRHQRAAVPLRGLGEQVTETVFVVLWWAHIAVLAAFLVFIPPTSTSTSTRASSTSACASSSRAASCRRWTSRREDATLRRPGARGPALEGPPRRVHLHRVRPLPGRPARPARRASRSTPRR